MKRIIFFGSIGITILVTFGLIIFSQIAMSADKDTMSDKDMKMMAMDFGGKEDVTFANDIWKEMKDYDKWLMKSDVLVGHSPHGAFVRLYYNIVSLNNKPYHVIIKDNYGGEDATLEKVSQSPDKYFMGATVMIQREAGYDKKNNDWFWVKYDKDGASKMNEMAIAGKVGMCIDCHVKAKGNDYIFSNDPK